MRHLQGLVRPQLRALILGNAGDSQPRKPAGSHSRSEEDGDRPYQESCRAAQADIGESLYEKVFVTVRGYGWGVYLL